MFARAIALAGGIAGAVALSQFPSFSQQYVQRLGGAVDELARFVAAFDDDAAGLGLSREQALVQLAAGGPMARSRARTVAETVTRHRALAADLAVLRSAGPFTRAYHGSRFADIEIARGAWQDFRPALPLSFEGAAFAGAGLLGGFALSLLAIALPARLLAMLGLRRRRRPAAPAGSGEVPAGPPASGLT